MGLWSRIRDALRRPAASAPVPLITQPASAPSPLITQPALPDWIRRWPTLPSSRSFDGVSDAGVAAEEIVEVAYHDARGDGEVVQQVAVVRLADQRWASLSYDQVSKTGPNSYSVTVAATRERIWWYGLSDEDREHLSPQLTTEESEEELVQIDRLLESTDPEECALGERRMLQRHRITDEQLVDEVMKLGLGPTGPARRETIATLGELRIDAISRDYWQYVRCFVLVLVVDGRDFIYRSVDDVDERSRVLEHLIAYDRHTREDVILDAVILAARDAPNLLAALDLLARFESGASDAQLANITPLSISLTENESVRIGRTVRRCSVRGTAGGWREVTCTIRWWADTTSWRCERSVTSVRGEDGMALS